jgi:hypothetical protein
MPANNHNSAKTTPAKTIPGSLLPPFVISGTTRCGMCEREGRPTPKINRHEQGELHRRGCWHLFQKHDPYDPSLCYRAGANAFAIAEMVLPRRIEEGIEAEDLRELRDVLHAVRRTYKAPFAELAALTTCFHCRHQLADHCDLCPCHQTFPELEPEATKALAKEARKMVETLYESVSSSLWLRRCCDCSHPVIP